MAQVARKTDLSPLEAIVVERTLGDEARLGGRNTVLAHIQQLTKERQKLYARSAGRPLMGPANALRIREITAEIERLWELLRRERAQRRVQIERALNVIPEDDDTSDPKHAKSDSSDAA
ncbi:MAG TPA: DUF2630 family protein [Ktedonobacterales bacterium]|jgi:hypothetical protein|nr:DUF2630 family protein [Ktedonobacterales bacterium]